MYKYAFPFSLRFYIPQQLGSLTKLLFSLLLLILDNYHLKTWPFFFSYSQLLSRESRPQIINACVFYLAIYQVDGPHGFDSRTKNLIKIGNYLFFFLLLCDQFLRESPLLKTALLFCEVLTSNKG